MNLEHDNYVYPGTRFAQNGFVTGQGQGMTLRDAAALAALQGVLASQNPAGLLADLTGQTNLSSGVFLIADAFIAARHADEATP
jgi:hypothetical protein